MAKKLNEDWISFKQLLLSFWGIEDPNHKLNIANRIDNLGCLKLVFLQNHLDVTEGQGETVEYQHDG